jgi:hypothetical protein
MRFWRVYVVATIVVILVIGLAVYWSFFSPYSPQELSLQYAKAQLIFTAVTLVALVFTLLYATYQFRISLARPIMKLTLDEMGATKKSIDLGMQQIKRFDIPIYAYNQGNKVATIYQIEFRIPNVFERYLVREQEGDRLDGKATDDRNAFIVSFYSYNKPEYICFINKYVPIGKVRLKVDDVAGLKSKIVEIPYKVFGDWGEPQEGSLKLELQGR